MSDATDDTLDAKAKILGAATRLFAHRGYGSTSVREVVEAAGVTKPTLYYYFDNKEALYVEAVRTHIVEMIAALDDEVGTEGSVEARIRRFMATYLDLPSRNPDGTRLVLTVKMPGDPSSGTQPVVDLMSLTRRIIEILVGLITEGQLNGSFRADIPPEDAGRALLGMAHMDVLSFMFGQPPEPDRADRTLDLFFNGVAA